MKNNVEQPIRLKEAIVNTINIYIELLWACWLNRFAIKFYKSINPYLKTFTMKIKYLVTLITKSFGSETFRHKIYFKSLIY